MLGIQVHPDHSFHRAKPAWQTDHKDRIFPGWLLSPRGLCWCLCWRRSGQRSSLSALL